MTFSIDPYALAGLGLLLSGMGHLIWSIRRDPKNSTEDSPLKMLPKAPGDDK